MIASALKRKGGSVLLLGCLLLASGCGSEDFPLGHVTGRVTCQTQPITNATILFTPVAKSGSTLVGKPATSKLGPDGSFELTTYQTHDGAVLGSHRVTVMFDGQELDSVPLIEESNPEYAVRRPSPSSRKLPSCARNPKVIELEVTGAENHFDIELSN
ncbi:hypothetical protein LOC68_06655 [Blastopirellula sp. JC732]|uniref:Carboxypeptidase regulatory-like domain-containing protein n=1 Tax=Blastopirellula sediminis TaxID=2894196 RepID=A0A9X1MM87_9BACT|nr:hypothetical protein [Blastopirellula sediminis]MCC9609154.1 hypothetical protein [Blastopirellula sediminis]MCC9628069.1 hypothetical protein [Blastopirellula sediminis]